ncbi:expressed unknown protein [Seminavis robusta]|uniref:Uncharacterized protein n=1 Tax=Seminavis robusta TaxID=568900 RepID=A0A9N8DP59_9STRA|nr:expressed unknown protein [Seminavis robusta]|eukprot:Sro271_g104561.1  (125) ;mRNA; f:41375-41749
MTTRSTCSCAQRVLTKVSVPGTTGTLPHIDANKQQSGRYRQFLAEPPTRDTTCSFIKFQHLAPESHTGSLVEASELQRTIIPFCSLNENSNKQNTAPSSTVPVPIAAWRFPPALTLSHSALLVH